MSQVVAIPVIEWSPTSCVVFDPVANTCREFGSIAQARSSISGSTVVVALSRRASFLRTARLPDAAKEEVAKIVALQAAQLLPVKPEEAALDFYLTPNRISDGRLAVLAAVNVETLRRVRAELAEAGLHARAIVPAALGSARLSQSLGKEFAAVVSASPDGIGIDVIHEGQLVLTRSVPPSNAEGSLRDEIQRTFAMAKLPQGETIAAGDFVLSGADLATPAIGLKFLASDDLGLHLELPEEVAKRAHAKVEKSKRLALLMVVAALGLGAVVYDIQTTEADKAAARDKKWVTSMQALRKSESLAKSKSDQLTKVDESLSLALEPKQRMADVVTLVSSLTPEGVWLTGLNVERGKDIQIRGTALNEVGAQNYLSRLGAQDRLRDVKLVFANNGTIETTNVVQFSITAHAIGNLPLTEPKKTGRK